MVEKKDLEKLSDGQVVETLAFIKGYDIRPAKNNNKYIDGILEMKGGVQFKVWSGDCFNELEKFDYRNHVCHITAKVNEYNGTKSLIVNKIIAMEEGTYNPSDFFETVYDENAYWNELVKLVNKQCSPEGFTLFKEVFRDIVDRFKVEFAARSHHDAVRSGLLAHTYKVAYITTRVMGIYSNIMKAVDSDLLVLGAVMHDIGKIYEYTNGTIEGSGLLVSHRSFGVEYLAKYKEMIVNTKNEEFYYRLLAIVEQHHGEYEETPRTREALLIHMVDSLESVYQSIDEGIKKGLPCININGFKLN